MRTNFSVDSYKTFNWPSERATQSEPLTRGQFQRMVNDAQNSINVLQQALSNAPGAPQNAAILNTISSNIKSIEFRNALPGEFTHMNEALRRVKQGEPAKSVARDLGVSPYDGPVMGRLETEEFKAKIASKGYSAKLILTVP